MLLCPLLWFCSCPAGLSIIRLGKNAQKLSQWMRHGQPSEDGRGFQCGPQGQRVTPKAEWSTSRALGISCLLTSEGLLVSNASAGLSTAFLVGARPLWELFVAPSCEPLALHPSQIRGSTPENRELHPQLARAQYAPGPRPAPIQG